MDKKFLYSIFVFLPALFFAQNERNTKFEINAGLEIRITPFHFKDPYQDFYYNPSKIMFNKQEHLSGFALNLGFHWFFLKNTSIGLEQYLRYDDTVFQVPDSPTLTTSPKKKLMLDSEIVVKHYFNLKNNDKIFALLGYGFMNNNTEYIVTQSFGDPPQNVTYNNYLKYNAIKIGAGYQYKNFESSLGLYFIEKNQFPGPPTDNDIAMGMPFLKLTYKIGKF